MLLSDGLRSLAVCRASQAETPCPSKGSVAARSWAGLQPGFISFTPHLAVAEKKKGSGSCFLPLYINCCENGDISRNPITGIAGCCVRSASGHAAAPPSATNNSRRPMVTVIRPSRARVRKCNDTTPRARCPNCVAPGAGGRHAGHRPQRIAARATLRLAFKSCPESRRIAGIGRPYRKMRVTIQSSRRRVRAACLEFGAERLGDLEVDDQFEKQLDKVRVFSANARTSCCGIEMTWVGRR